MTKVIFQEIIRVSLSDSFDHSPADKNYMSLTLRIDERQSKSEKEFTFNLSKEEDPRFVYSLPLRRSNYDSLRHEQDLVCDFDSFPKMIADFIRDLQRSSSSYLKGSITDDKSLFRFELIAKMDFKWVCVVSLCLHALSDAALVIHLVDRVLLLKKQLRELNNVRDNLVEAQAELKKLKEAATHTAKEQLERIAALEAEKNEALAREKAVEERLTEEIEDLKTDREMLSTEVSMLRQEVIDFRARVDGLVEENVSLKERERTLNDTLDSVEDRLDISEQKATELAVALEERDEEIDAKMCEINNLREMLEVSEAENASLQAKLRELREDRDRWRADNEKGIKIINKLYKEQKERRARCDEIQSSSLLGRVRQLETDLEERKRTIDAMSESNAQLRGQVENVVAECAKAKKDAEEWAAKYDKKEKMLGDLLKLRHNTSPIGAPLMQLGTTPVPQTPIVYPRMLGWSTMTGQLTTPLRTSPYARGPQLSVPNNENVLPASTPTTSQLAPTQPNQS